jgi:hypothetical protein
VQLFQKYPLELQVIMLIDLKRLNIDIDKFISLNEIEQEKLFYPKNVCTKITNF